MSIFFSHTYIPYHVQLNYRLLQFITGHKFYKLNIYRKAFFYYNKYTNI